MNQFRSRSIGFTLAELLVCLAILGVIATFTIPKVLQAQQDERWRSSAKDTAAMVSAAFNAYKMRNQASGATKFADFSPYMNYVRRDVTSLIDATPTNTSLSCAWANYPCLVMHTGGTLMGIPIAFGGTGQTQAIHFYFDPDGIYSDSTDGPGKAVQFYLYFDGKIADRATIRPSTYTNTLGPDDPDPLLSPAWFHW